MENNLLLQIIAAVFDMIWLVGMIVALVWGSGKNRECQRLRREIAKLQDDLAAVQQAVASTHDDEQSRPVISVPDVPAAALAEKTNPVPAVAKPTPKILVPGMDFAPEGPRGMLALFYLGAFFVIAAAWAFIASDYGALMPGVKTLALVAVTMIFALGGYYLARQSRWRVAGIVYVGIALIFIPTDGVAYFLFHEGAASGTGVWLVTSLAFVTMAWLFYRSVLKNQLMLQFILTGLLSTLWAVVRMMGAATLTPYCVVACGYGYGLYYLSAKLAANQKAFAGCGTLFALGGAALGVAVSLLTCVGYMLTNSLSQRFQLGLETKSLLAEQWSAIAFALAGLLMCAWRFAREQRDGDWHGVIIAFLVTVWSLMVVAGVDYDWWYLVIMVLAYGVSAILNLTPWADGLSPVQKRITAGWAAALAIWGGFGGMVINMPWEHSVANDWSALAYTVAAMVYFGGNYVLTHRLIELTASVLWGTQSVAVVLILTHAPLAAWVGAGFILSLAAASGCLLLPEGAYKRVLYCYTLVVSMIAWVLSMAITGDGAWLIAIVMVVNVLALYLLVAKYARRRNKYELVSFLWVVWWWFVADRLGLDSTQWYSQAAALYLLVVAYGRWLHEETRGSALRVALAAAIWSALCWFGEPKVGPMMTAGVGVLTVLWGQWWRQQKLRRVGVVIVVVGILAQTSSILFHLPVWLWYALMAVGILGGAMYYLRREQK